MKWAADTSLKVEIKTSFPQAMWFPAENPDWDENAEYRIKSRELKGGSFYPIVYYRLHDEKKVQAKTIGKAIDILGFYFFSVPGEDNPLKPEDVLYIGKEIIPNFGDYDEHKNR